MTFFYRDQAPLEHFSDFSYHERNVVHHNKRGAPLGALSL